MPYPETKKRSFRKLALVERWKPHIEAHCPSIDTSVVLALIAVESSGNPYAHRDGSQFYGLLQIGRALAGELGRYTSSVYHGDGPTAIKDFNRWLAKYESRHQYDPDRIAIGWKAGVGTLKKYNRMVKSGKPEDEIATWLEDKRWNTWSYVTHFRDARSVYSTEVYCD